MASGTVSVGPYPDRAIRVGACVEGVIVAERTFDPGADVVLGSDPAAGLAVPGWRGPSVVLISRGTLLHLAAGMRLIMCDEAGGQRVTGTFEELQATRMTFPTPIPVSRLNVRVQPGVLAFVLFVELIAELPELR